jgi:hypothetical protein
VENQQPKGEGDVPDRPDDVSRELPAGEIWPTATKCKIWYREEPKEDWHKRNKQKQKLKQKIPHPKKWRERKSNVFDSTKGYPGEGPVEEKLEAGREEKHREPDDGGEAPPNRIRDPIADSPRPAPRMKGARRGQKNRPPRALRKPLWGNRDACMVCGRIVKSKDMDGHQCQPNIAPLPGESAAAMADRLDPRMVPALDVANHNNPDQPSDEDGSDDDSETDPEPEGSESEESESDAESELDEEQEERKFRDEMVSRMYELATARLARPGPITTADEKVIKGAMANIPRFRQSYEHAPMLNVSSMVCDVYRRAYVDSGRGKTSNALANLQLEYYRVAYRQILGMDIQWGGQLLSETPVDHRRRIEALEPYASTNDVKLYYWAKSLWVWRTGALAVVEELGKRMLGGYFGRLLDDKFGSHNLPIQPAPAEEEPEPDSTGLVDEALSGFSKAITFLTRNASKRACLTRKGTAHWITPPIELRPEDRKLKHSRHIGLVMASACLSGVETLFSGRPSVSQFLVRFAAHTGMAVTTPKRAVATHFAWNIAVPRPLRLNLADVLSDFRIHRQSSERTQSLCTLDYPTKMPPQQDGFKIMHGPQSCVPSFGTHSRLGVIGYPVRVFRNCTCNERVSLAGRVGKKLPQHSDKAEELRILNNWRSDAMKTASDSVIGMVLEHAGKVRRPYPFWDWVEDYPAAKRDIFKRIKLEGSHTNYDLRAKSFIKVENKAYPDEVIKDPRMIQGCPPELTVIVGPYVKKAAKRLRDGLRPQPVEQPCRTPTKYEDLRGKIVYTCGLSNEQIGHEFARSIATVTSRLEKGDRVVILEDDQSRYDLHLTRGAFERLDYCYSRLMARKAASLLKRRGKSRGVTRHKTKYEIPYTMQSGWPDTAYGDTLGNAILKTGLYEPHGSNWIAIICGDDSVTITTQHQIDRMGGGDKIVAYYADYGLEVTCAIRTDPLDAEFCSGRFHPCGDSYVLMPKIGKLLARLGTDRTNRTKANSDAWLRGIAQTFKTFGQVDPLCMTSYAKLDKHLKGGKIIVERKKEFGHKLDGSQYVDEHDVLSYYSHHYGFRKADLDECRAHIMQTPPDTFYTHPFITYLAEVDC